MAYYINFTKISIIEYRDILKNKGLIPSQKVLLENIDKNFALIADNGIKNIDELLTALKTKKKIEEFAADSGVVQAYLTALNREIKGSKQKPNRFCDFPNIDESTVSKLENIGLKNTLKLYDRVVNSEKRKELVKESGLTAEEVTMLTKLTDLSRIKWVNHTFAFILYHCGFDTLKKVANSDYNEIHKVLNEANKNKELYRGNIGLNDMKLLVEFANDLPFDIEY